MKFLFTLVMFALTNFVFSQTIYITSVSVDTMCNKGFFQINYQANGSFSTGNVFYAELSDENGSFTNAISISYTSSAMTGMVGNWIILDGLPAGSGYRIRMVSSDPTILGNDNGSDLTLFYPEVNMSVAPNLMTATSTLPTTQYQWLECSHFVIPGETNQSFGNGTSGTDYAIEITQFGCVDTSDCHTFIQSNSIDEWRESVSVGPNPTDGVVEVDLGKIGALKYLFLYNLKGELIQKIDDVQDQLFSFRIESEAGAYFLKLIDYESNVYDFKLLKK